MSDTQNNLSFPNTPPVHEFVVWSDSHPLFVYTLNGKHVRRSAHPTLFALVTEDGRLISLHSELRLARAAREKWQWQAARLVSERRTQVLRLNDRVNNTLLQQALNDRTTAENSIILQSRPFAPVAKKEVQL